GSRSLDDPGEWSGSGACLSSRKSSQRKRGRAAGSCQYEWPPGSRNGESATCRQACCIPRQRSDSLQDIRVPISLSDSGRTTAAFATGGRGTTLDMPSLSQALIASHDEITQRWYDAWRHSEHPHPEIKEAALK